MNWRRNTRRRFAAFCVGAGLLIVVFAVLLLPDVPGVDGRAVTAAGLFIGGSIAMVSNFRRYQFSVGRRRKAWLVLSISAFFAIAANVWSTAWSTTTAATRQAWYTSADIFIVTALVVALVGLALFPTVRRRATDLTRMVLDGLVIGGSVLFVTSVTVFPQLLAAQSSRPVFNQVTSVLITALDILVATLAGLLIMRGGRSDRVALVLLSSGFCLYTISDLLYAARSSNGRYEVGTIVDLGWIAGYLLIALGARHPDAGSVPDPESRETSPVLGTVVLFAVFLAAALVSLFRLPTEINLPVAAVWMIVIVGVIGRQIFLIVDNERLRRNLEHLVQERTRELRGITRQRELLLSSVGDGIYGVDTNGLVTFVNPATCAVLKIAEVALIGRHAHTTFHAPRPDGSSYPNEGCYVDEAINAGLSISAEEDHYVRGDGETIAVEVTANPLSTDEGISGAVVVFRDVTERREVDRMKSEFVSIVSHELRTPLTSIRGSLGLVAGGAFGDLPVPAVRMLDIALESSDRLTRLINDILDIERIESGTMPMNVTLCEASQLVGEAIGQVSGLANDRGVLLHLGQCHGVIRADPDRILQTLINLLGNAIKFSDVGSVVRVDARVHGTVVEFSVTDHGRGIPEQKIDAIFGRFTQVDSSDAREKGGTGLGLAISRSIVERLGGRIWAESTVGVGSIFRFTVPHVAGPAQVSRSLPAAPTVLVCDDDAGLVDVLCALLSQHGYRPIGTTSGNEAIALVRAERPHVVLLDLRMPGMSGSDVLAALRADDSTSSIPVVILSGLHPDGDIGLAASADGWLTKPVDDDELAAAVAMAIDRRQSHGSVLIVEDDDQLARVISALLERRGLSVRHVSTQSEAFRFIEAHPPQVLILDLNLPDGNGFDLVARLRETGRLSQLPLIVYSAADLQASDKDRLALGETVFLTKARISPQQLEHRVVALIDRVVGYGDGATFDRYGEGGRASEDTGPMRVR